MRSRDALAILAVVLTCLLPAAARANARLVSVTPIGGGCVYGPTGPGVEAWDVLPGMAYLLRFDHVFDAADGGMDPTLPLLMMSSVAGNQPCVATRIGPGTYVCTFIVPASACETMPIRYGVQHGAPSSGRVCGRHDSGISQSHLRMSTFGLGCTHPQPIRCLKTAVQTSTWGALKSFYR